MKKIRLGLVGLGFHGGQIILEAAKRAKGLEVVAVCDTDPAKEQLVAGSSVAFFTSLEKMLKQQVDGVCVATPVATHRQIVDQVTRAKKAICLGKPIARDLSEAELIFQFAKASKVPFMVDMTTHYRPEMKIAAGIIERGEIGIVRSINERIMFGHDNFPMFRVAKENLGGVALENGVHGLGHLLFWGGPIEEIKGCIFGNSFLGGYHEDTAIFTFEHQYGVISTEHLQWMPYNVANHFVSTIFGSKGYVEVHGMEKVVVKLPGKGPEVIYPEEYMDQGDNILINFEQRHWPGQKAVLEDFANLIRDRKPPYVPIQLALDAHKWVFVMYNKFGRRIEHD